MNTNKINELCSERGITLLQLSKKIGMSNSFYTTLKSGSLKVETLEKIAEALEVPVTVFFDIELPEVYENKITDLEKKLSETEEKLQTRQSIINLVLYSLKNITTRYRRLYLSPDELKANGYEDLQLFLNDTIESLSIILNSVRDQEVYNSGIWNKPFDIIHEKVIDVKDELSDMNVLNTRIQQRGQRRNEDKIQINKLKNPVVERIINELKDVQAKITDMKLPADKQENVKYNTLKKVAEIIKELE